MKQAKCEYCKAVIKASFDRGGVCFSCQGLSDVMAVFLEGLSLSNYAAKSKVFWIAPVRSQLYHLINLRYAKTKRSKDA